ncbi:MAG: hypothetical protein GW938_16440 [Leptospira sp.]|nr:hypothetical protein [Leptospira sp.]
MALLRKYIRVLGFFIACNILVLDCLSSEKRDLNLIVQDDNFAIFQLNEVEAHALEDTISEFQNTEINSLDSNSNELATNSISETDSLWDSSLIQSAIQSTLVVQSSLLSNTPSKIFSKEESYSNLSNEIALRIKLTQNSNLSKIYFIVVKENDDLAPFTRILRTSFYIFRKEDTIHLYFGEIRESISFLSPYTFSDWISAPKFTISKKNKSRITFKDNKKLNAELLNTTDKNQKEFYLDAIKWSPKRNDSSLSNNRKKNSSSDNSSNSSNDPESRLRLLEDLKKKGLISIEEYQSKRKEMIDGL